MIHCHAAACKHIYRCAWSQCGCSRTITTRGSCAGILLSSCHSNTVSKYISIFKVFLGFFPHCACMYLRAKLHTEVTQMWVAVSNWKIRKGSWVKQGMKQGSMVKGASCTPGLLLLGEAGSSRGVKQGSRVRDANTRPNCRHAAVKSSGMKQGVEQEGQAGVKSDKCECLAQLLARCCCRYVIIAK